MYESLWYYNREYFDEQAPCHYSIERDASGKWVASIISLGKQRPFASFKNENIGTITCDVAEFLDNVESK